ncbi:hypothetical protein HanPSC8_Chr09g0365141 [Helianthus annuus]|nr:hypothetical protein HanPSC8_Chr09g0365141 [Helianthus annuus]
MEIYRCLHGTGRRSRRKRNPGRWSDVVAYNKAFSRYRLHWIILQASATEATTAIR